MSLCLNAGVMGRIDAESETLIPIGGSFDVAHADQAQGQADSGMAVRRLTPLECCRLQGFQDDYLDITYRGKPAADGPKYKALGNSMAVPVMAWIGRRIQMICVACPLDFDR